MSTAMGRRKIVIPGGSGQVGTVLARAFHRRGSEVVVLSRRPTIAPWRVVAWDARTLGPWAAEFEGAAAIINLVHAFASGARKPGYRALAKVALAINSGLMETPRPV